MLTVVWGLGWVVTSIERTAYPQFKRLITAHELHLFFSPTREELEWAADRTDSDEHLLALAGHGKPQAYPEAVETTRSVTSRGGRRKHPARWRAGRSGSAALSTRLLEAGVGSPSGRPGGPVSPPSATSCEFSRILLRSFTTASAVSMSLLDFDQAAEWSDKTRTLQEFRSYVTGWPSTPTREKPQARDSGPQQESRELTGCRTEPREFRETEACSVGTRGSVRVHQVGSPVGSAGTRGCASVVTSASI